MEKSLKFNSQVCTTREQSQRLLALGLKPETADMVHIKELAYDEVAHCTYDADTYMIRTIDYLEGERHRGYIPAWSLHRLMEIGNVDCFNSIADAYDEIIRSIVWDFEEGLINSKYINPKYLNK